MNAALQLARTYGVEVHLADLGDWGTSELRSEYDPDGPVIRINLRVAETMQRESLAEFVTLCVGHELYHHRECIGEVGRLEDRIARESAADAFARALAESRA